MRQPQQNNRNNRQRNRGRRNNNSGGGNPANKVYDSNGPEVRVRGSAQTVADKYLQLAGDAQSQGDSVTAESYFQFAEHYLRIVAAAQAAREQKQAEKEKIAEEHAARIKAKKAKDEEAKVVSGDGGVANQPENNSQQSDSDSWEGPKPAFLKGEDADDSEKLKKPRRRKPPKSKPSVKENSDDDVVAIGETESSEVESSAAE